MITLRILKTITFKSYLLKISNVIISLSKEFQSEIAW